MRLFILIIFNLLLISGCEQTQEESLVPEVQVNEDLPPVDFDLDKILERGKIIAAIENNSISYFSYRGRTMGYQYELMLQLADFLGVEFEMVVTKNIAEAFRLVNTGAVDVAAFTLTVTKERKKKYLFTDYQYTIRQVLVQRKAKNWRKMKIHEIEKDLLRNQVDLIGKKVNLRYNSSFIERIQNLSNEIGGEISIIEENESFETEDLIRKVAEGVFDYTVSDEDIAKVNALYYPILDVNTPISFPTQIAWAVRLNAENLRDTINIWQKKMKKGPVFNVIYNKYFENPRASRSRISSDYFSEKGGMISKYDDQIKKAAKALEWDWRLLAALIYRESKFDPKIKSWAGAMGLMQVMPATGKQYGITELFDPESNILAGEKHLEWITRYFEKEIPEKADRIPFIVASYNVGLGHIIDARNLTEKYGRNKNLWFDNVDYYVLMKAKPKYYNDPVVKYGYCRGEEPVKYVEAIRTIFKDYINLYKPDPGTGIDFSKIKDIVNE